MNAHFSLLDESLNKIKVSVQVDGLVFSNFEINGFAAIADGTRPTEYPNE